MDKTREIETSYNHSMTMNERKTLYITGVKKLENFDNEEFFLETVMGFLLIKGNSLELVKLDTFQGTLSIKGKVCSYVYLDEGSKKIKGEGVMAKLFK